MCITCLMSTKLWSPDRTTSLRFSLHQRIDEEWKEKQRVAVGDLSGIISHRSLNLGDNSNTCLFVSPGRLPPHPPLSEQDCFTLPLPLHEIPASLSVCVRLTRSVHTCVWSLLTFTRWEATTVVSFSGWPQQTPVRLLTCEVSASPSGYTRVGWSSKM